MSLAARQICTFRVGGQTFGVAVDRVQEVLRRPPMTRVPLAHPHIRGLINLRGQIVMAIDLRLCLGAADSGDSIGAMSLILRSEDGPVSVLVDAILDVVAVDGLEFEAALPHFPEPARHFVQGSYHAAGRLILVLDADALLGSIETHSQTSRIPVSSDPGSSPARPHP